MYWASGSQVLPEKVNRFPAGEKTWKILRSPAFCVDFPSQWLRFYENWCRGGPLIRQCRKKESSQAAVESLYQNLDQPAQYRIRYYPAGAQAFVDSEIRPPSGSYGLRATSNKSRNET